MNLQDLQYYVDKYYLVAKQLLNENLDIMLIAVAGIAIILIFFGTGKKDSSYIVKGKVGSTKYVEKRNIDLKDINPDRNEFVKHIFALIIVSFPKAGANSVYLFYFSTLGLGALMTVISARYLTVSYGLILTAFITAFPYMYLRMKLKMIRVESSYEGTMLVEELINQYKINYKNMIEAIDQTIINIPDSAHVKKALFRLARRVKEYADTDELRQSLNEFSFSINTQWAHMLTNNMYLSIAMDTDVVPGVEDILVELNIVNRVIEDGKRETMEGIMIAKFFIPGAYIILNGAMIVYGTITVKGYLDYVMSPAGIKSLLTILIAYILSNFANSTYNRRKFDI